MGGKRPIAGEGGLRRGGSTSVYGEALRRMLKAIWLVAEQPSGRRLKTALVIWLPPYGKRHGILFELVRARVLRASTATIDRLLAPAAWR